MESMDASICREERRNRKRGRGKKMEDRGAGKRMLTDCKAISDPPPTHRASIRLDIPLCKTHLINTQTMLWDLLRMCGCSAWTKSRSLCLHRCVFMLCNACGCLFEVLCCCCLIGTKVQWKYCRIMLKCLYVQCCEAEAGLFFLFFFLEMAAALFNGVTFDLEALHLKLFE